MKKYNNCDYTYTKKNNKSTNIIESNIVASTDVLL